jgi:hypothetical protein
MMYFTRKQWVEIVRVLRLHGTKQSIMFADRIDAHWADVDERLARPLR